MVDDYTKSKYLLTIFMDDVEIPADYLIGNEGEGFKSGGLTMAG